MAIHKAGQRIGVNVNGAEVGHFASTGDVRSDLALANIVRREAGYGPTILSEWEQRRLAACDFAQTFKHTFETTMSAPRTVRPFSAVPLVVLGAFSLELFLKAIACKHGHDPGREHKLYKIAMDLPVPAKRTIALSYRALCADRSGPYPDVDEFLKAFSDAFIKWRYSYEHESLQAVSVKDIQFCQDLFNNALEYP